MKRKKILKSFLLLSLALAFSVRVQASEITGVLTSNGQNSTNSNTAGAPHGDGPALPANVSSGSASGSASEGSQGNQAAGEDQASSVSSEETTTPENDSPQENVSADEMSLFPAGHSFAAGGDTVNDFNSDLPAIPADNVTQSAAAAGSGVPVGAWLWIIPLLALVGSLTYVYLRRPYSKAAKENV